MAILRINMQQFRERWKTYADNIRAYEVIVECNGKFSTDYPDRYTEWLLEFNIFYTQSN